MRTPVAGQDGYGYVWLSALAVVRTISVPAEGAGRRTSPSRTGSVVAPVVMMECALANILAWKGTVEPMRMRTTRRRGSSRPSLCAAVLLAVGCGDSTNLIGPEHQLEVTNAVDQFQFQLTALDGVTDTRRYDWQNTGTQATIDVSQAITAGSAILVIMDANGDVLYQADLAEEDDSTTPAGVPGTWRIEVLLTKTTGTFNFRVQKAT